ncbi:CinA family protein [Legionella dresdenensis]|uniref:CinA family protein n=1 Tax=Legionella dresdenensis TaxID=450200 RepID=A0ABV8CED8_9GAMM
MIELESILFALTEELKRQGLTIATAESCTGGMVAAFLTEKPGSSVWFERGFVTYSNLAKQEMLGVDEQLIKNHGAVSIQVAEAMAIGALNHSTADVALSVTGIAGPDGGSAEKPVGTVCFGYIKRGMPVTSECCLFTPATRDQVRHEACKNALNKVLALISR